MNPIVESLQKLSEIPTGKKGTLTIIQAGKNVICRLSSLGLTPGANIEVLQNYGKGPLIVNARGTRVALGRGMAGHLLIKMETIQ